MFSLNYGYGSSGSNNGQITGITDNVDNGRSATYSYDGLGRISTANTTGSTGYPAWGLSWSYDRYGNRTAQTITAGSAFLDTETYGTTAPNNGAYTNRTDGHSYDASGNMTSDGWNTLTYDAASHLISAVGGSSSGAYTYDGNGLRVKKSVPSTSPTTTTVYIFSGTKVIAEYDNGAAVGSPTREYLYAGSQLLATINSGGTKYHHPDHLSARVTTDSSGSKVGEQSHYPFGESWYAANITTKYQFTTYEHDSESGNEFAMARYDISRLGRFSSPDPIEGSIGDPQSLNRYAYASNDPVNRVDPSGLGDGLLLCTVTITPGKYGEPPTVETTCEYQDPNNAFGGELAMAGGGGQGGGGAGTAAAAAKAASEAPPWCDPVFIGAATTAWTNGFLSGAHHEYGFAMKTNGVIKTFGPGGCDDLEMSYIIGLTSYLFHTHPPGCANKPSSKDEDNARMQIKGVLIGVPMYTGTTDGLWYTNTAGHSNRVATGNGPDQWFKDCPH